MKKFVLGALLATGLVYATSIDTSKVSMSFTAFKTPKKAAVEGTFDGVQYHFNKDTSSVVRMLDKASASIDVTHVNLHDELKSKNVKEAFFDLFKDKNLKVFFRNVVEGENQGSILATVRMNGRSVKVPMTYTIENNELTATGLLDVLEFGLKDAFAKLAKACEVQHEKLTWSQVRITFKAGLKD
ncbi:YceI family protein [Helicobacter felis]|uniref:Periplasmic protein n=1 Tax=Helicobacter felis (strain ATCC 49179 / CCUG 28539 / NCTC 12436 / CS1) TaxID=936155 RepID=E7ACF6_HELFC|nr:YceI family protein [Helicobacter felis]CBY82185.1 putative periplasmic protein [Helicobacter felis ATCC 49179]